jgi:hypothetical protein
MHHVPSRKVKRAAPVRPDPQRSLPIAKNIPTGTFPIALKTCGVARSSWIAYTRDDTVQIVSRASYEIVSKSGSDPPGSGTTRTGVRLSRTSPSCVPSQIWCVSSS